MKITAEQARAVLADAERLHDAAAVDAALAAMARQITKRLGHAKEPPLVLVVMTGGLIPAGQLLPKLEFPLEIDYIHATRYRGSTQGGDLIWIARPQLELRDRTVLILDDILDEGHTLAGIIEECEAQGAREVLTAVLVEKLHDRRHRGLRADFVGVEVDDRYVFGAGMDYKGFWRNLPGIFAAKEA